MYDSTASELTNIAFVPPSALCRDWLELCARYLPLHTDNSFWRYSRLPRESEPDQGWKLHVSATVLTACEAVRRIGPFLNELDIEFKAPASLFHVVRINAGIRSSYTQIGKLITVYPRNDDEAAFLGREIYLKTRDLRAPSIPFEERFGPDGCVYYRYGKFRQAGDQPHKKSDQHLRDPNGRPVADDRRSISHPAWAHNPFPAPARQDRSKASPLSTTYVVFRALSQRGKGGVYQALDSSVTPPRLCVIKEGRALGEQGWDGRDGRWRVKHERRVITSLRTAGVDVPRIVGGFTAEDNYYLVTEHIEGTNLMTLLLKRRRRLSIVRALNFTAEMAAVVAQIHAAGWVWRDCKPSNFVLSGNGRLRPLDFEGAYLRSRPDRSRWATPGYAADWASAAAAPGSEDVYAIGASLYLLLTGRLPQSELIPAAKLRRNLPATVNQFISELLSGDGCRLSAVVVSKKLLSLSRQLKN